MSGATIKSAGSVIASARKMDLPPVCQPKKKELQKKQKTLDIIRQNFTALLDAPEISSDLLPAKREPVSVTRDK